MTKWIPKKIARGKNNISVSVPEKGRVVLRLSKKLAEGMVPFQADLHFTENGIEFRSASEKGTFTFGKTGTATLHPENYEDLREKLPPGVHAAEWVRTSADGSEGVLRVTVG